MFIFKLQHFKFTSKTVRIGFSCNSEIAFEAKYYKNGNCHLRFRKDLMLALNVAAGRLFGWVTSPEQAADEMDEDVKEVAKYWQKSDALCITNKTQLIGLPNFN